MEKERKSGGGGSGSNQQQSSQKTEHVVHCQACARKRNHLLDNFVILNQYNLDDLKNIYDQFQLYVPSIVGLINNSTSTASTAINNTTITTNSNLPILTNEMHTMLAFAAATASITT